MKLLAQVFSVTAVVFLIVDGIWLGLVAWPFYQREVGHLLRPVNLIPAIIFYIIYIIGILVFVIEPNLGAFDVKRVITLGFLFGVVCYATYDLTNLSTLKDWSWKVTIIDIIWGGVATSTTATIVTYLFRGI